MRPHDIEREPADEDDPVARFFARAREEIRPGPTSDLSWQEVLRGKRTSRRPTGWYAAVATAAAVVAAVAAIWTWQQPIQQPGVTAGSAVAPTSTSQSASRSGAPEPVSGVQRPRAVPSSFTTWSLSNVGHGTIYDLGSSNCRQEVCVTLLRSVDNGRSWSAVHDFSGTDTSSATGSDLPQIQPAKALTESRFVTAQVGYVFGGDLWVTRDRGASFTRMRHPGQTVLDVEIWEGDVVVVSADGCAQGTCGGPLYVSRIRASTKAINEPTAKVDLSSPISAATALVHDGQVDIQLTLTKAGAGGQALRLRGDTLRPIAAPPACRGTGLQAMTVAAQPDNLLYAVCNPQQQAQNVSYTVVRSADSGTSWSVQSVGALVMPRIGQLTLAAGDSDHVVASMGGPRDPGGPSAATSVGSLQISTDQGRRFKDVTASAQLPSDGFDWSASPGGDQFYALSRQDPGYWWTKDNGARWTVVNPTS